MDTTSKEKWLKTRELGYLRFVLQHGVLYWGVPMFVFMTFIAIRPFQNGFYFGLLAFHVVIWVAAGAAFGVTIWTLNERKLKKSGYPEGET